MTHKLLASNVVHNGEEWCFIFINTPISESKIRMALATIDAVKVEKPE